MEDKNKTAYQQLLNGISSFVDNYITKKAKFDVTKTAICLGESDDYGYTILLENKQYRNIGTIGGTCSENETVYVLIPQNNMNNMIILK